MSERSWPKVPLGDVVKEITVGHVGTMRNEYVASGIPFFRSQNVKPYRVSLDGIKFITPTFHAALNKSSLRAGDVVIVRTGHPGTAAVVPEGLGDANCADLVIVRPSELLSPRFLTYFLNSRAGAQHVHTRLVGAVQQHFNVKAARAMVIPCPTFEEQNAIAGVLGALDDKIELNREMNETLEEMARALFKSWFVDFDPVRAKMEGRQPYGMDADTAALFPDSFEDSTLGMIPKGWSVARVEDLIVEQVLEVGDGYRAKRSELAASGLPFARAGNINNGFQFSGAELLSLASVERAGRKVSMPGDVVFTSKGTVGRFAFVGETTPPFAYSPQLCFWRSLSDSVLQRSFLFNWMKSRAFLDQVAAVKGQTDMADYVSLRDQRRMRLLLPSGASQACFQESAEPLLLMKERNVSESQTLAELRDTLLPKLLSGEVRVPEAEELVEAS